MRKAQSYIHGHGVYYNEELKATCYADSNMPVENNERPCVKCQRLATPKGHDACMANLPGVKYACCGHGDREQAYVMFENGMVIRGFTIQKEKI